MGKSASSVVLAVSPAESVHVVDALGASPALSAAGVAHATSAPDPQIRLPQASQRKCRTPEPRATSVAPGREAIRRPARPGRGTHISENGLKKRPLTCGGLGQARVLYSGSNWQKRKTGSRNLPKS